MKKLFTLLLSTAMVIAANAADFTATQSGNWSDAATWGGSGVPAAGDNVSLSDFVITVDVDATCDNLTFTSTVPSGTVNRLTIAANKKLTVRGKISQTGTNADTDVFGLSDATSILELTGAVSDSLIGHWATGSVRPKHLIIAAANATTKLIGNGAVAAANKTVNLSTGKLTVKTGTTVVINPRTNIGKINDTNLFTIESGATVTSRVIEGDFTGVKVPAAKVIINGTLIANDRLSARILEIGATGLFKTGSGTATTNGQNLWDGWWHNAGVTNPVGVGQFGTPTSMVFAPGSTIEYNRTSAQNIIGIVPENKVYTAVALFYDETTGTGNATGTLFAAQPIPYQNIKVSGSNTKTIQSNLIASGNLTVASGTLLIPAGKVAVVLGDVTVTSPAVLTATGAFINAKSADNAQGTVSATISATNEVALVATAKPGFQFVNWTEDTPSPSPSPSKPAYIPAAEISTSASLPAFTPTDGTKRTIMANFSIWTGVSTPTKATTFVTVEGNTLKLQGNVTAVDVFDVQGRRMVSERNVKSVNVKGNGIYIVKMHTPQGVNVQKINIK